MGQCSNCKHWKKNESSFKSWGRCRRLASSSNLEIIYEGFVIAPPDVRTNTYEEFSCKHWECSPDSFDQLEAENVELQRTINIMFDQVVEFIQDNVLPKDEVSFSKIEDFIEKVKKTARK